MLKLKLQLGANVIGLFQRHALKNCIAVSQLSFNNRNIYTRSSLLIDKFESQRANKLKTFHNVDDFINETRKCLEIPGRMILGDDLKKFLIVAESDEDLDIMRKLMARVVENEEVVRFQSFSYGPEIMRLYYVLGKPREALSVFKDSKLSSLFNQVTSTTLLMNLLFQYKMYKEMLEAFELYKQRLMMLGRLPSTVLVLAFAACYKLNTPESFQVAKEIWQTIKQMDYRPNTRIICFFAKLAQSQGEPVLAYELSGFRLLLDTVNIKLLALSDLKRFDDIMSSLKQVTNDQWENIKICRETLSYLKEKIKEAPEEYQSTLASLENQLEADGLISFESLDYHLCRPMDFPKRNSHKESFTNQGRHENDSRGRNRFSSGDSGRTYIRRLM